MTMTVKFFKYVAFSALPVLALGCTQSTTSEDVSDARQDVIEEQQDVTEEQQDVAEARHEAMKPAIDSDDVADEQGDVQEEQQDVAAAEATLKETERDFNATQARDAFAMEAQGKLDEADRQLEALETRKDSEEDAAAEATQLEIDQLTTARDGLEAAIDDLKGADLQHWQDHKQHVQSATNELNAKLQPATR
jgi:chromosome segregation ATPase